MMRLVPRYFLPAHGARELVIASVGIAETKLCFQVPMPPQYPGITVSYPQPGKPTLIANSLQLPHIGAQEMKAPIESSNIILPTVHVGPKKMTGETVAEPVPYLGLQEPVPPSPVM